MNKEVVTYEHKERVSLSRQDSAGGLSGLWDLYGGFADRQLCGAWD